MQMNTMTTQAYVADHRAQLLAEARRFQSRNRRHAFRRLFSSVRRPAGPVALQPKIAPASAH